MTGSRRLVTSLIACAAVAAAVAAGTAAAARPDCIAQISIAQSIHRGGPLVVSGAEAILICEAPVTRVRVVFVGARAVARPTMHTLGQTTTAPCKVAGPNAMECAGLALTVGTEYFFDVKVDPLPGSSSTARVTATFAGGKTRTFVLSYPTTGEND